MATSRVLIHTAISGSPRPHCHYSLLTFLCKGRPRAKNADNSLWTGFAMTMAAAIESRTAEAKAWSKPSHIASIDILHDLSRAEAIWRRLEDQQHFSTPYQRFDFLQPWQRRVGAREGLFAFLVLAHHAARRPPLLPPLALGRGVRH